MKDTLSTKILHRESSDYAVKNRFYRRLYSDRSLVANLDIVNELDGHSGCVNALSWSKGGELLASGSDDQHLNIHRYQAPAVDKQFKLETTIATGHTQNIFSVKFMPHSQDRTVITAAGDGEVRIFDIEYSGTARTASSAASMASEGRRRGRSSVYNGVKCLSDGDTNCRVYRSHGDRVKRIVTESSPHLFLTCSEDGEVRQWDLRQPSSAYPSPRGGRHGSTGSVPPPLISYKRYNLDLNSISCSASQPYYIALGGAHLHALLHDRRMAGRDRLEESGTPMSSPGVMSEHQEAMMTDATKCVRKFAPQGQSKMRRSDNGHITALKISDARPDEMIVSWSGDHIYSFDLVRSPAAGEDNIHPMRSDASNRVKDTKERKRKRRVNGSESSTGQAAAAARAASRLRTDEAGQTSGDASLRIRYQNGQQEEFRLPAQQQSEHSQSIARMTGRQLNAQRIAKATVDIRTSLFDAESGEPNSVSAFTSALGRAASWLSNMDEIMQEWTYPIDPLPIQVTNHKTLRRNRETARRFVQAAGVVARILGGKLQTPSSNLSPLIEQFGSIQTKRNDLEMSRRELFGYEFLKAITLWLDSGLGNLINGFTRPTDMAPTDKAAKRLPILESEATPEAIQDTLIPYLLELATDQPITNPSANRFETNASRLVFPDEKTAVRSFGAAVQLPFADLSDAAVGEGSDGIQVQDRQTACRYWGLKVARGVLLNAAEGVSFVFVDRAFGGLGRVVKEIARQEAALEPVSEGEDEPVQDIAIVRGEPSSGGPLTIAGTSTASDLASPSNAEDEEMMDVLSAEEAAELIADVEDEMEAYAQEPILVSDDENDDDESNDEHDSTTESSSDSDSDDDNDDDTGLPRSLYQSAFSRRHLRCKVAPSVPCSASTRTYRGHCNVKTVKDVNFFGLDDEYVVSGSDDGNLFIWDRQTSELVNVLQGDGEVVNVVQGHPYETMLAVSGIDHTIKIFSPDARAREVARLGRGGVEARDSSDFSTLAWPSRTGRRASRRSESSSEPAAQVFGFGSADASGDFVAPTGLASRKRMHESYAITQQNDVDRQGGNQDSFVTRSMLAQLALRLRAARAARFAAVAGAGAGDEGVDEVGRIARAVQGDDCCVM